MQIITLPYKNSMRIMKSGKVHRNFKEIICNIFLKIMCNEDHKSKYLHKRLSAPLEKALQVHLQRKKKDYLLKYSDVTNFQTLP